MWQRMMTGKHGKLVVRGISEIAGVRGERCMAGSLEDMARRAVQGTDAVAEYEEEDTT